MKYVVDTSIVNWLADGRIKPEDLPEDGPFLASPIQIEELNKTKDEERRLKLWLKFAEMRHHIVPTESMVVGVSRIGHGKMSDGSLVPSLKKDLDSHKNEPESNARDALIAEVAIKRNCVLLTADRSLEKVATAHGCDVRYYEP